MKHTTKKKKRLLAAAALLLAAFFFAWQNNCIVVTEFTYASDKLPKAFDGFVLVQVSDLHNKTFGVEQRALLEKIESVSPDLIVVTGDLIDRRRFDMEPAMELIDGALKLAPVLYVSGNHEAWSGHYGELCAALESAGVTVLDDETFTLTRGGASIAVSGARDPDFLTSSYAQGTDTTDISRFLETRKSETGFQILLSHRPELFELYVASNMDMVFSGHAHGGQVRIPFAGALYAPDQGFFPKYADGRYENGQTTMFVSRGLGNSLFPLRVFNRPELIAVTLHFPGNR